MDITPTKMQKVNDELHVVWSDGVQTKISWRKLRNACPCAACGEEKNKPVDPFRVLSAREVAAGLPAPVSMKPVGHYAYQVQWNDGHGAGIYTIESIRKLSEPLE